jgi:hypothetical protein
MIIVHEIVLKVITYEFFYYMCVICLLMIVTFQYIIFVEKFLEVGCLTNYLIFKNGLKFIDIYLSYIFGIVWLQCNLLILIFSILVQLIWHY